MAEMIFAFESKVKDDDWQEQFRSGEHDFYSEPVLSEKVRSLGMR